MQQSCLSPPALQRGHSENDLGHQSGKNLEALIARSSRDVAETAEAVHIRIP